MITKLSVDWAIGWGNLPRLIVTVDRLPDLSDFRFRNLGTLYWGVVGDIACFFSWRGPNNNDGYGGSHFEIVLEDGTPLTLKGPWSSNTSTMNEFFPHTVACVLNGCHGYYPLKSAVDEALPRLLPDVELIEHNHLHWVPTLRGLGVAQSKEVIKEGLIHAT